MCSGKSIANTPRFIFAASLILTCLIGVILAQTFQYSRGWTNGKKRSPLFPHVSTNSGERAGESFGICHMQKLRQIIEKSRSNDVENHLPCEMVINMQDIIE